MAGIDDYKQSLEGINSHFGQGNKRATGSLVDYQNQVNHYQDYLNQLDEYSNTHGKDEGFDYTKWKLYRDYASGQLKNAQDSYSSAIGSQNAAQAGKLEQANIKENSLKYAQAALKAQGIEGQGVGGSVMAGINNQYGSNVAAIENTKNEQQNAILNAYKDAANIARGNVENSVLEHEQNARNDSFALASELMNNGSSYDRVIELYGDKLSNEQKAVLQETYKNAGGIDNEWLTSHNVTSEGFTTYEDMVNSELRTENIDYTIKDVANEAKILIDQYTTGRQNGDCVRLEHEGGGSTNGLYMIYYNGKWYKTNKSQYDAATNKGWFKGGKLKDDKSTGTFKN